MNHRPHSAVFISAVSILITLGSVLSAESFTSASWLGDHMILPADRAVPVQGTASPGATVKLAFANREYSTRANKEGEWEILLDPLPVSSQPRSMSLSTKDISRSFSDVLVGYNYLCSGQSNMNFTMKRSVEKQDALSAIKAVELRYFNGKSWKKVTEKNVLNFSAVGTWFAMEMARLQEAPAGLFVAAVGGTGIEAWLPASAFPNTEEGLKMKPLADDPEVLQAAKEDAADFKPYGQHRLAKWGLGRAIPASLFERLIRPHTALPISGICWYQGESNALSAIAHGEDYAPWLKNLIASWRDCFGSPDLPFIIIQLPEFDPKDETKRAGWAAVQKVQSAVGQELKNVSTVSTMGLGNLKDIHPRRKKEVGLRAAAAAYRELGSSQPTEP